MWSIACKAPLSMEFSRQEYWTEQSFPSLGDLPNPGIEPRSCALQVDLLPFESPGKPIGGNVNWYSHCGKQYGGFSKKTKIELSYDPGIPLLGTYLKKPKHLFEKIHASQRS